MRLIQLIATMNPASGGPQENARQIASAMKKTGGSADFVTLDEPASPWGDDCSVVRLGPTRLGNYGYSERLVHWLRTNVRHYDAAIVHGLWQYHGLATWRALAGTDIPYFVFPHGMLDPWFKQQFPLKHLKKTLYWDWAEYRVLRDAQAVLFTCEEERRLARSTFTRYRVNEAVVGCGISSPQGDPAQLREVFLARYPQLRDRRLLLFLGRLHPKKGCDQLLDAFANVSRQDPTWRLVMAGPGDAAYYAGLVDRAEKLGVSARICWTGMLRDEIKWGAYHAADSFVLPSHQENFGIAVAEALACGVPVLVSNKVNIWREIVATDAGFAADDTPDGTRKLLFEWLQTKPQRRSQMRHNALACFRAHFHIDATTANLLDTIRTSKCKPLRMSAA